MLDKTKSYQLGEAASEAADRLNAKVSGSGIGRTYAKGKGAVAGAFGRTVSWPFRAAAGTGTSMLLGEKAKRGPMAGKRMHPVPGGPGAGMREVGLAEYLNIKDKRTPGKVFRVKADGKVHYYARKFRPGGIVGSAMKHPLIAGGGLLAAYLLAKKPMARNVVSSVGSSMAPSAQLRPEMLSRLQRAPSFENPLAREVWSK